MALVTHRTGGLVLYGSEESEIIETLEYYQQKRGVHGLDIPYERKLETKEQVIVDLAFPRSHLDQYIRARVAPDLQLDVNATFFSYLQAIVATPLAERRRGALYKFGDNGDGFHTLFFPKLAMKGIYAYDWDAHGQQVQRWRSEWEHLQRTLLI